MNDPQIQLEQLKVHLKTEMEAAGTHAKENDYYLGKWTAYDDILKTINKGNETDETKKP